MFGLYQKKYVFSVLSPGLVMQRQIVPSINNVCVKIGRSDADTFFLEKMDMIFRPDGAVIILGGHR